MRRRARLPGRAPLAPARSALAFGLATGLAAALLAGGCRAPREEWNKTAFWANEALDHVVLTPAAGVYRGLVPPVARRGVRNFFANLGEIENALNQLLQGKWARAGNDAGRFLLNTTMGGLGVIDAASVLGLPAHDEDLGQTLGAWGVPPGPYLVLPVLGPTTLRDVWTVPASLALDPLPLAGEAAVPLYALHVVDERAAAEPALRARAESALDPYEFTKAAWLRRRELLVHDGAPPEEAELDELETLLEEAGGP